MAVHEEIFRLKYDDQLSPSVRRATAALAENKREIAAVTEQYQRGDIILSVYEKTVKRLTAQQRILNKELAAAKRPGAGGGGLGGLLGGGERGGALARSAFNLGNVIQDAVYNPLFAVNNLLQPYLWTDLATAVGGTSTALSGFGAVVAVTAAGLIVLDDSLKDAGLSWGDLDDVIGELAPVKAAKGAFDSLTTAVGDFATTLENMSGGAVDVPDDLGDALRGLASVMSYGLTDLASWAVGWDDATEAVKKHKEALEAVARLEAVTSKLGEKFQSDEQKEAARRGGLFAQALADASGKGGMEEVQRRFALTQLPEEQRFDVAESLTKAAQGDVQAQERIRKLSGAAGLPTGGLDAAMAGRNLKVTPKQIKGMARAFGDIGKAFDDEFRDIDRDQAASDKRKAKGSKGMARAFGDIGKAFDDEFRDIGKAQKAFDDWMNAMQAWSEQGEQELEANARRRQDLGFGIARGQLGMAGMLMDTALMSGPRTMKAAGFAQSVQDSQESTGKKQVDLLSRLVDLNQTAVGLQRDFAELARLQ